MVKSRILVIDDEAAIRDSLRMIIEYEGYEFVGASSGPEGIALVERESPDLVFLDIKMPGMDGFEVLERIKAVSDVPVVMISGKDGFFDKVRGRMAGIELLSYSIGPLLGQLRSSTAASLTSLRMSFVSGGVLCIIGVGIAAVALPTLWKYDDRTSPDAVRERAIRRERDN